MHFELRGTQDMGKFFFVWIPLLTWPTHVSNLFGVGGTVQTYSMYEIPDHKVGIYCNVIGPLAALRHCTCLCKKVLRYFGKVRHQSNVRIIHYDWLILLYIFIPLVRIASFLIIKSSCVTEELTDVNSPLVRAPPQLTFFTSPTTPSTPRHMRGRQFPML